MKNRKKADEEAAASSSVRPIIAAKGKGKKAAEVDMEKDVAEIVSSKGAGKAALLRQELDSDSQDELSQGKGGEEQDLKQGGPSGESGKKKRKKKKNKGKKKANPEAAGDLAEESMDFEKESDEEAEAEAEVEAEWKMVEEDAEETAEGPEKQGPKHEEGPEQGQEAKQEEEQEQEGEQEEENEGDRQEPGSQQQARKIRRNIKKGKKKGKGRRSTGWEIEVHPGAAREPQGDAIEPPNEGSVKREEEEQPQEGMAVDPPKETEAAIQPGKKRRAIEEEAEGDQQLEKETKKQADGEILPGEKPREVVSLDSEDEADAIAGPSQRRKRRIFQIEDDSPLPLKRAVDLRIIKKPRIQSSATEEQPKTKREGEEEEATGKKSEEVAPDKDSLISTLREEVESLKKRIDNRDMEMKRLERENRRLRDALSKVGKSPAQVVDLVERLSCSICTDFIAAPSTLCCGHTFCFHCIHEALLIRKSCPVCRDPVSSSPAESLLITQQVYDFVSKVEDAKERQAELQRLEQKIKEFRELKATKKDVWHQIFPKDPQPVFDQEDDMWKCAVCNWELESARCGNCNTLHSLVGGNYPFGGPNFVDDQAVEEDEQGSSDDEEEDEDEDEDDEDEDEDEEEEEEDSFVVPDDHEEEEEGDEEGRGHTPIAISSDESGTEEEGWVGSIETPTPSPSPAHSNDSIEGSNRDNQDDEPYGAFSPALASPKSPAEEEPELRWADEEEEQHEMDEDEEDPGTPRYGSDPEEDHRGEW